MLSLTLSQCLVAMNTAHVSALFGGGVGKPLGKVGGACPLMATTTQPGCAITRLGRPLRVSFTVLASPGASSACSARCLASSQVSAGMGAGLGCCGAGFGAGVWSLGTGRSDDEAVTARDGCSAEGLTGRFLRPD